MYKILILSFFICTAKVTYFLPSLYAEPVSKRQSAQTSFDLQKFIPEFEASIQKGMELWEAPGVAVVIVVDGRIVYEKGFGVTAINNPEDVTEHTVFPLASLSKPFVASLAMILVDEKKIDLDEPVTKWFPELKIGKDAEHQGLHVGDLMRHNSGLPGFSGDTMLWLGFSTDEILKGMAHIPQQHPARTKLGYQNILFGVLGLIMEKSTGESLKKLVEDRVVKPLDMKDTFIGPDIMQPQSWFKKTGQRIRGTYHTIARPHDKWHGKVNQLDYSPYFYTFLGSTCINTSAHDMGLWMIAWMQQKEADAVWKVPNYQKMIKPTVYNEKEDDVLFVHNRMKDVGYGMGWYVHTYGSEKVLSHMGGLRGIRSIVTFSLDKRVGIAVMSNLGGMRISSLPEALRNTFWDAYLKFEKIDWNQNLKDKMDQRQKQWREKQYQLHHRIPAPSMPHSYYMGVYRHDVYGDMKIVENDQKDLVMKYRDKDVSLKHVNGNIYQFEAKDLSDFFTDSENPGIIEWGGAHRDKAELCDVYVMHEGEDPFHRVADQ